MNDPASNSRGTSGSRLRRLAMAVFVMLPAFGSCAGDLDPGLQTEYCKTHDCKGGSSSGSGGMTGGGTGGASPGSGGMSGPACDAYGMIFKDTCAQSGCHSPGGTYPDLSTDAAASSLVGKAIMSTSCKGTGGNFIVNSGAPLGGTLFTWIAGTGCGAQMPFLGTPLTTSEIDCIKSYFTAKLK